MSAGWGLATDQTGVLKATAYSCPFPLWFSERNARNLKTTEYTQTHKYLTTVISTGQKRAIS